MKKIIVIIVSIIIVALGVIGFFLWRNYAENGLNYVILSVNPEIELIVDQKDQVKEVIGLDDAGDLVIADLNLKRVSLTTALDTLVKEIIKTGYLNEYNEANIIVATVISNDETTRLDLESEVAKTIEASLDNENMPGVVAIKALTDEMQTSAVSHSISNGKMLLITKALELNTNLKETSLAKQSMYKIEKQIKIAMKDRLTALEETQETLQKAKQVKIQEASSIKTALELTYKLQNHLPLISKDDEETKAQLNTYLESKKNTILETITKTISKLKSDTSTSTEQKSFKYISIKEQSEALVKETVKKIIKNK
jgi:hypothetical protein